MKSKAKFLLVALMLIVGCLALALVGCKPDDPTPPTPPDYSGELSSIIVNSLDANLKDGFAVDFKGNVGFAFDDEDKSKYNWNYDYSIQANLFSTTMSDLAIEIKQHGSEDIVFGLYNKGENLYFTLNDGTNVTSYNFENAPLLKAVRALVYNNVAEVPDNIKNIYIGEQTLAELANEYIPGVLPMLIDTETMTKNGNDYTAQFEFAEVRELLFGALGSLDLGDISETITNLLDSVLPQDISAELVFKTDGTNLKGLEVNDAAVSTATDDGTFNFKLDAGAKLFQNANNTLDVKVPTALTSLPATKILSINADGNVDIKNAAGTALSRITWSIKTNLDAVKMAEYNFLLNAKDAEDNFVFADNFLHLQVAINGMPLIDLGFDPDGFNSADIMVSVALKHILGAVEPSLANNVPLYGTAPEYFMLPIDTEALPETITALISLVNSLTGGAVGVADVDATADNGLGGIGDILNGFLSGNLDIAYPEGDIVWTLNRLFQIADGSNPKTISVYGNNFAFGVVDNELNVQEQFMLKRDKDGFYSARSYAAKYGTDVDTSMMTVQGLTDNKLNISRSGSGTAYSEDAKTTISYGELMNLVGYDINYTGIGANGKTINGTAMITGIVADKNIIGEKQKIKIYTSFTDPTGLLAFIVGNEQIISGMIGEIPFPLSAIWLPAQVFEAEITLTEVDNVKVQLFNGSTEVTSETVFKAGQSLADFRIKTTITYKAVDAETPAETKVIEQSIGVAERYNTGVVRVDNGAITKYLNANNLLTSAKNVDFSVIALGTAYPFSLNVEKPTSISASYANMVNGSTGYIVGDMISSQGELAMSITVKYTFADGSTSEIDAEVNKIRALNLRALTGSDTIPVGDDRPVFTKSGVLQVEVSFGGIDPVIANIPVVERSSQFDVKVTKATPNADETEVTGTFTVKQTKMQATDNLSLVISVLNGNTVATGYTVEITDKDGKPVTNLDIAMNDTKTYTYNFKISGLSTDVDNVYTIKVGIKSNGANKIVNESDSTIATTAKKVFMSNSAVLQLKAGMKLDATSTNLAYIYAPNFAGIITRHNLMWDVNKYVFMDAEWHSVDANVSVMNNGIAIEDAFDAKSGKIGKVDGALTIAAEGYNAATANITLSLNMGAGWSLTGNNEYTYESNQSEIMGYVMFASDNATFFSFFAIDPALTVANAVGYGDPSTSLSDAKGNLLLGDSNAFYWATGAKITVTHSNGNTYTLIIKV